MPRNEHEIDRQLRVFLLAPLFIALAFLAGPGGVLAIVLFALGAVMLLTGIVGFCPLYRVFGVTTCRTHG